MKRESGMCKSCNCSCCLSPLSKPPLSHPATATRCWPNNSMKLAKSSSVSRGPPKAEAIFRLKPRAMNGHKLYNR